MKVAELIALLQAQDPTAEACVPGYGSADGNWVKATAVEAAIISPSKAMFDLYGKKPEDAYEFSTHLHAPEWDKQYGFKAVLLV